MAKRVVAVIRLQVEAGAATPAPPIGPALSQHRVNIMQFIKEYNEKTAKMAGMIVPVEINVHPDSSFTLVLKSPPASALLRKAANLEKGASTPGVESVAKLSREQLRSIAKTKAEDLNAHNEETAINIIAGSARSMGIEIEA